jgi:hypothetical protein
MDGDRMLYYIVAAYKNESGKVILNATATNEISVNVSTKHIEIIDFKDNYAYLGEILFTIFGICLQQPRWSIELNGNVEKLLGIRSYSKFLKEYIHVIVELVNNQTYYSFTPTVRKNGGYVNEGNKPLLISVNESYEDIGETLVKAFDLAK